LEDNFIRELDGIFQSTPNNNNKIIDDEIPISNKCNILNNIIKKEISDQIKPLEINV